MLGDSQANNGVVITISKHLPNAHTVISHDF